jgi:chaperonin cofactor prefoldin
MADKHPGHTHPDSDQRIKTLEEQVRKLQEDIRDLQHKMQTHEHPHSH